MRIFIGNYSIYFLLLFVHVILGCDSFVKVRILKEYKLSNCLDSLLDAKFDSQLQKNKGINIKETTTSNMIVTYGDGVFSSGQKYEISYDKPSCSLQIKTHKSVQVPYGYKKGNCEEQSTFSDGCLEQETEMRVNSELIIKTLFEKYLSP